MTGKKEGRGTNNDQAPHSDLRDIQGGTSDDNKAKNK